MTKKPRGYWTKEKCQEEALKYQTKNEFKLGSCSAYGAAYRNGWLDEICSHMEEFTKPRGYWTKENCHQEALKYQTRREFYLGSGSAYSSAIKNGWIDEICSHMEEVKKPRRYWTKENCHKEALKYQTRSEFYLGSGSAYSAAKINSWLDDICSHMDTVITKPRGYWTKENCHQEALKYQTRSEFYLGSNSAYNAARKNKWLDDICLHMEELKRPSGHWSKENCHQEALKYQSRNEFRLGSNGAYDAAGKNGCLDEICSHMEELKRPSGYWTKENCHIEALKYQSRNEFKLRSNSAYNAANINNWSDEICSHMETRQLIDIAYMWNTIENPHIWKFGISNNYLVEKRINQVLKQTEYTLNEVIYIQTDKACELETKLLKLGKPHVFPSVIDGKSEFRILSINQETKAKKLLKEYNNEGLTTL